MRPFRDAVVATVLCLSTLSIVAQSKDREKNEVATVIGATETPSVGLARGGSIHFNSSITLGLEYDRLLIGRRTTLSGGIDFLASPADVKVSYPTPDVSPEYASLFLTPHIKLKFNSEGALRPWAVFGGGYADFAPADPRNGIVKVGGKGHSGTLEFGGGVDTRAIVSLKGLPIVGTLPIATRFEVRDFYSGQPHYGLPTTGNLQNNVAFNGGLLFRF